MLNIGIVGLKNAKPFIEALSGLSAFSFRGIYDPCLLMDRHLQTDYDVFRSFGDLCLNCQAVIFSIDDNLYHPLICEAIRHSLDVFIGGVHTYQTKELNALLTLRDEAGCVVHIGQPLIYTDLFKALRKHCSRPLDIQCNISKNESKNLVALAHSELGMLLSLVKAPVHKVSVNVYSSFGSVPDTMRVRLDFDNGTVGNVCIARYGLAEEHHVKVLNYNSLVEADMLKGQLLLVDSDSPDVLVRQRLKQSNSTIEQAQLTSFYSCIMGGTEIHNCLENEIRTQLACERVREKMRVNFNVF